MFKRSKKLKTIELPRRIGSESYFPPITVEVDGFVHTVSGVYRYYYSDGTFEQVSERRRVK